MPKIAGKHRITLILTEEDHEKLLDQCPRGTTLGHYLNKTLPVKYGLRALNPKPSKQKK